jgi:putative endonuclease
VLETLLMKKSWIVYLLCCSDGKIYTGVTNDLEKRLEAHNKGTASRFTRARLPVTLLATSRLIEKEDAFRLEYRIKRLSREKKLKAIKDG